MAHWGILDRVPAVSLFLEFCDCLNATLRLVPHAVVWIPRLAHTHWSLSAPTSHPELSILWVFMLFSLKVRELYLIFLCRVGTFKGQCYHLG